MIKRKIVLLAAIKERYLVMIGISLFMFFVTPIIQSINTSLAFEIWLKDLYQKPISSGLYIALSIAVGIYVSLYMYTRNKCIDCEDKKIQVKENKTRSGYGGFFGSFIGFMLGVCPACFSFIGFLIPLSTSIFLSTYTPIFTSIALGIIIFSIYKLGGFKLISLGLINK